MSHNGSSETSSFIDECWASWFCNLSGNHFFCEIDKAYMEDSFNLFGLKQHVPKDYSKALDTILDRLAPTEAETEELSRSAALLYGLIHARYIITSHGLESMHRKYVQRGFGECPRMLCRGQPVLPMGHTDDPKHCMVKLFCPKCQDVYSCAPNQRHIDGAFFGPTFPNLFFMTYEDVVPEPVAEQYVPRVFGFRIHHSSNSLPRAGSGGRNTLSLYSGYAPVVGPHNPGFFNHFGATAAAGSSSHTHSLLTQGNLANNNNNGNHTSTSISESQSAATKCVTVGGKRRNTSASDGHQSASSSKGMEPGSVSSSMLLQGNDAHLASLSQAQGLGLGPGQGSSQGGQASSSSTHGPSSLTYTGLDGKIGVDKIEHTEGRNGQGQCAHPAPQKDRETLGKTLSRTPHQRNAQAPTSTETSEKTEKEFEQFPAKRARTTSTSRDWTEGNTSKDK